MKNYAAVKFLIVLFIVIFSCRSNPVNFEGGSPEIAPLMNKISELPRDQVLQYPWKKSLIKAFLTMSIPGRLLRMDAWRSG